MAQQFVLHSIGVVRRADAGPDGKSTDHTAEVALEIDPHWETALAGLEGYSHLQVVALFDRAGSPPDPDEPIHPEGRGDTPAVGRFATRTPVRPNPLAVASPRLVRREGRVLWVTGIDLWDGTPILDLKGYSPRDDQHPDATVPGWLSALWALHDRERAG